MTAPGCPLHSDTTDSHRKALKPGETTPAQRVNRRDAMWRIGSLAAAKQVLLARHETIQAGFTAEYIPRNAFRSHPILIRSEERRVGEGCSCRCGPYDG